VRTILISPSVLGLAIAIGQAPASVEASGRGAAPALLGVEPPSYRESPNFGMRTTSGFIDQPLMVAESLSLDNLYGADSVASGPQRAKVNGLDTQRAALILLASYFARSTSRWLSSGTG